MNHSEQAHGILGEHVRQYVESYASAHTAPREEFAQGVKHSREGVKHPHRVASRLFLETPETQMCGLPSLLRIRMVLMATGMAILSRVHWQPIGWGRSGGVHTHKNYGSNLGARTSPYAPLIIVIS